VTPATCTIMHCIAAVDCTTLSHPIFMNKRVL
jgi:hypothetical protein